MRSLLIVFIACSLSASPQRPPEPANAPPAPHGSAETPLAKTAPVTPEHLNWLKSIELAMQKVLEPFSAQQEEIRVQACKAAGFSVAKEECDFWRNQDGSIVVRQILDKDVQARLGQGNNSKPEPSKPNINGEAHH